MGDFYERLGFSENAHPANGVENNSGGHLIISFTLAGCAFSEKPKRS